MNKNNYVADTKIKERPLAFVDLEFTGLGPEHEILQIGCVMVSQPDFSITGEWEAKVKPLHIESADPEAMKIVGYSEDAWKEALSPKDALEQFNEVARDAVLIGFNVVGDFYQLKKTYQQAGLIPAYHWQVLDVQSMLFADFYDDMVGFRMREVVEHFGLKNDHWHDALADARATYEIFKKIMDHHG